MPWTRRSARTAPLPPDWKRIRAAILTRDGHQCTATRGDTATRCTNPATDVDHIGDPTDHRPHMLRSLCAHHHRRITGAQGGGRVRKRATRRAPKHPGLKT